MATGARRQRPLPPERWRSPADELIEGKNGSGLQKILAASASAVRTALLPVEEARFGPCITRPQKIIMLGFNYRRHAQEAGTPFPKAPVPRDVSEADALGQVFGYATGNDFSARDLQYRDGKGASQFMIGKTCERRSRSGSRPVTASSAASRSVASCASSQTRCLTLRPESGST